ncbi:MAG: 3-deoxy-8-phosphooctulonate synthase, partial [Candidatus Omnitrophota bacterium]
MKQVVVKGIRIGDKNKMVLIAGPCVIESENLCLNLAKRIKEMTVKLDIPFVFKASFDKANRMSLGSFRGPGIKKGLDILNKIKDKVRVPVLSDVHCVKDILEAAKVLDIIQ